ncbi:MAG: phosphonopyruvate decarboxylase [Clostridia bacterium]|nr:phosphonopyruvate decarboxylase [Clostridia bacterium]MBR0215391.1 phosphonopyruvate decarboxylase [Clostridia bacterium]
MQARQFIDILGADFYTGVPDSQLKALCSCLLRRYGVDPKHHVIAANEGNCAALAAGYHLATGKVPVVYMQNSGEGNIVNPVASLLHDDVYGIPMIFVIGWRGEPGVKDEPQHVYQGRITCQLLKDLGIDYTIVSPETTVEEAEQAMEGFRAQLAQGRDVAFVIRKEALTDSGKVENRNRRTLIREDVIRTIAACSEGDPIVSTTGKASRELFEIREQRGEGHENDFLTVGSMGHASSIALGIASQKEQTTVWCIDGDGAALMHMGALAVIGACRPDNLVHIVIDNEAHETVGGMPTVSPAIQLAGIARDCGYAYTAEIDTMEALVSELKAARDRKQLTFLQVHCALGSRKDLGRPTTTPKQNKAAFMKRLAEEA